MTHRFVLAGLLACLSFVVAGSALGATASYQYDALGRLTNVTTSDGKSATYVYDPAGNRTSVVSGTLGVPSSITVPASSTTGSYSVSWGSATGAVTAYELYEATNPSFSGETRVYSGTGLSAALSGRGNGTYYYRVRACFSAACGGYIAGSTGVTVAVGIPPGVPSSIAVPSSSTTGSYTVSWGSASGTVTAYEVYEATNSSFSGQTIVYNGVGLSAALSGRANGTYYYRARACNTVGCSGYVAGSNAMTVTIPTAPGVPSSIAVPSSSTTGSYSVSWGSATGTVTSYELYEATNPSFSGETIVYNGAGLSASLSGRANGTYYYRARACNTVGCSSYVVGSNAVTVSLPVPIQVLNPAISVGATGQVTQITTLANLNGNAATINSFTLTCTKASTVIQGGAQSVAWTNTNTFLRTCELGRSELCSASYVISNSSSGQQYSGTSAITVLAQGQNLGSGQSCP